MKKDIILIAVLVLIVYLIIIGVKIESVEEHYLNNIDKITDDSEIVTFSINVESILNNWELLDESLQSNEYVPSNGFILKEKDYVLRDNDSIYDLLLRITKYNRIHMEVKNFGNSKYIQGINYIYEFSCGPLSGWMILVNGNIINNGVSSYKLKDKDIVEIKYTCDLGRDILAGVNNEGI